MKNKIIEILIVAILLISCDNNIKEYYPNGKIKKEYFLNNGKLNDTYKEYYQNGQLKVIHLYKQGVRVDSSIYYDSEKYFIKQKDYYLKNDSLYSKKFFNNLKIKEEGKYFKNIKIGKWKYYRNDGTLDKVFEYWNLNGKQYTNQGWFFDRKNDTIKKFGNYFNLKLSTTHVKPNDFVLLNVDYKPILSLNSNVVMCFSSKIKSDFSNVNEVTLDTLFFENNRITNQRLLFKTVGKKIFRGYIKEFYTKKGGKSGNEESVQRKLYFNFFIIVENDNLIW